MTHPVAKLVNSTYQPVASWSTDRLHELLASDGIQHVSHDLTRCVLLMELLFRLEHRPEMPALVWQLVFGDQLPPPDGLMSPSQAHPQLRGWATH